MPIVPLLNARHVDVDSVKAMTCKELNEWLSSNVYDEDEAYKKKIYKG